MGNVLAGGGNWNSGYHFVSIVQILLAMILVLSLPLWKRDSAEEVLKETPRKALSLVQILRIPGAKAVMFLLLLYC